MGLLFPVITLGPPFSPHPLLLWHTGHYFLFKSLFFSSFVNLPFLHTNLKYWKSLWLTLSSPVASITIYSLIMHNLYFKSHSFYWDPTFFLIVSCKANIHIKYESSTELLSGCAQFSASWTHCMLERLLAFSLHCSTSMCFILPWKNSYSFIKTWLTFLLLCETFLTWSQCELLWVGAHNTLFSEHARES
jgi:hypothetical protein